MTSYDKRVGQMSGSFLFALFRQILYSAASVGIPFTLQNSSA